MLILLLFDLPDHLQHAEKFLATAFRDGFGDVGIVDNAGILDGGLREQVNRLVLFLLLTLRISAQLIGNTTYGESE